MTGDLKTDILLLNNCFKCFRILRTQQIQSGQRARLSDPYILIKMVKEQKICFKELNMTTSGLR
jgi:hypothetical protein